MARKKRKGEGSATLDVGMMMNISLFLILLTFFVLFNSIAVIDEIKKRAAVGSLVGAFGSFTGGLSAMKTGESILPPSAPIVDEKAELGDLMAMLQRGGGAAPVEIRVETALDKGIITINRDLLFEGDTPSLKTSSYPVLDKLAGFIKKGKYQVDIIGHTDNRPAEEKGFTSNWELSSLLVTQVQKYFVEKHQISPLKVTAYGRGGTNPIATNETKATRALNRRVEIVVYLKSAAYVQRIFKKKPAGIFTYKKFDFRIF